MHLRKCTFLGYIYRVRLSLEQYGSFHNMHSTHTSHCLSYMLQVFSFSDCQELYLDTICANTAVMLLFSFGLGRV